MLQKYQNEISPIIYYGINTKINEKDLKIPILQPPDWKSPYWMSLYDMEFDWRLLPWHFFWIYFSISSCSCSVSWFLICWQCWNIKCRVKFWFKQLDWFGKCRAPVTPWNGWDQSWSINKKFQCCQFTKSVSANIRHWPLHIVIQARPGARAEAQLLLPQPLLLRVQNS